MEVTSELQWHPALMDPTGRRSLKPRAKGKTMVIDKGLGIKAFEDLLQASGEYIDLIKIGFGTSVLYPYEVLQKKIEIAKTHQVGILPGGTFLEIAVHQNVIEPFFNNIVAFGFTHIEVSDGTIDISRTLRDQLISKSIKYGLNVVTEYGKKMLGTKLHIDELINTIKRDISCGSNMVTIEGRESGRGVGIFDEEGACRDLEVMEIIERVHQPELLMWETPLKSQQLHFIKILGSETNLGNIAPEDIMSVEALRRGLRSDTFCVNYS